MDRHIRSQKANLVFPVCDDVLVGDDENNSFKGNGETI